MSTVVVIVVCVVGNIVNVVAIVVGDVNVLVVVLIVIADHNVVLSSLFTFSPRRGRKTSLRPTRPEKQGPFPRVIWALQSLFINRSF